MWDLFPCEVLEEMNARMLVGRFNKIFSVFLVTFFCLTGFLTGCAKEDTRNTGVHSDLTIKVLDIGQGDSILIKTSEQTILIDTGDLDKRNKFREQLQKAQVKTIDKLIITHPHADHIGGAKVAMEEFDVKAVYDNGQVATPKFYREYLKIIKEKKIPYHKLYAGENLDFGGGVVFEVLNPTPAMIKTNKNKRQKPDLNGNSITGRLVYKDFSIMLTGDLEKKNEKIILDTYGKDKIRSTLLKSPHHGSKTSSSEPFLKALESQAVLISVGKDNDYGHPHDIILKRYDKYHLKVYRTDLQGTLTVKTDGKNYTIEGER